MQRIRKQNSNSVFLKIEQNEVDISYILYPYNPGNKVVMKNWKDSCLKHWPRVQEKCVLVRTGLQYNLGQIGSIS